MNTKLIFEYAPDLTLDKIESLLAELYPEYPLNEKGDVLRLRKSPFATVGVDMKNDYGKRQSVIQIYHKPSLGATLLAGAIAQSSGQPFVDEVAWALKHQLASEYHLIEEKNKVKPKWTTRNKVGVSFSSLLFLFMISVCIISTIDRNIHTLIYEISEDGHFNDWGTNIRGGENYSYIDAGNNERIIKISKDSTYVFNATDDDWILYSVDYTVPYEKVDIPEGIVIWIPAHSVVGCEKLEDHIWDSNPRETTTLYEQDVQRGYRRELYLQKSIDALGNIAEIYGD